MSVRVFLVRNKGERRKVVARFFRDGFKEIAGNRDLRFGGYVISSFSTLHDFGSSFIEDVILKDIWESEGREGEYGVFYSTAKAILNWLRYYGIDINSINSQQEGFERFKEEYVKRIRLLRDMEVKKISREARKGLVVNPYSISLSSYVGLAEELEDLVVVADANEEVWVNRLESLLSSKGFDVVRESAGKEGGSEERKGVEVNITRFFFTHSKRRHAYTYTRNVVFFYFKSLVGLGLKREENGKKIERFIEDMFKNLKRNISKEEVEERSATFLSKWRDSKEEGINYIFDLLLSSLPSMYYDKKKGMEVREEIEELRKAFYISNKLRRENGDLFLLNAVESAMRSNPLFIRGNSLYLPVSHVDSLISPPTLNKDMLPAEMSTKILNFSNLDVWSLDSINILVFRNQDIPVIREFIQKHLSDKGKVKINVKQEMKEERKAKVNINKFSYSQLDMYSSCPYKYYMKYLLYLPSFPQPFFEFGSIVHEALEDLVRGEAREEVMNKASKSILSNEVIRDKNNALEVLNKIIPAFIERNSKLPAHQTIDLESLFSIPIKGGEIMGYIDRVIEDEEGIKIIDYKTSKNKKSIAEVERDEQLSLYAYAFSKKYGKEVASILLWYVVHDEIVEAKVNVDNIEEIMKTFEERISKIKRGTFYPVYGQHCSFCDLFMLCPIYNSYFYFL